MQTVTDNFRWILLIAISLMTLFNHTVDALNYGVKNAILISTIVCLLATYLCGKLFKK